MTGVSLVLHN